MKTFLVAIDAPDRFSADDAKATLEKIGWVDGVKILSVMEKQPQINTDDTDSRKEKKMGIRG